MKRLSDYEGEAAIDLWAEMLDIVATIVSDPQVAKSAQGTRVQLAHAMMKHKKKEVCELMLKIDDTPINGLNIITRLVTLLNEVAEVPELAAFFGLQGQKGTEESSGSATENTKAKEQ